MNNSKEKQSGKKSSSSTKRKVDTSSSSASSNTTEQTQAANAAKKIRKGKTRGAKYTGKELDELLDLVEEYLPTGGDEWEGYQFYFYFSILKSYSM